MPRENPVSPEVSVKERVDNIQSRTKVPAKFKEAQERKKMLLLTLEQGIPGLPGELRPVYQ